LIPGGPRTATSQIRDARKVTIFSKLAEREDVINGTGFKTRFVLLLTKKLVG
jgi:hypothetical protein